MRRERIPLPRRVLRRTAVALTSVVIVASLGGCIIFRSVTVEPLGADAPRRVETPVKAHLGDGSTVVFREGVTIEGGFVRGIGQRYDLSLAMAGNVTSLSLDEIVGMESYRHRYDAGKTFVVSTLTTGLVVVGASLAFVALFGSCPTVYSDSAGVARLEAESFSYSVAPLFEARDVDRLHAVPSEDGVLRLEVRNEALETHYLNHLELVEVRHPAGAVSAPDPSGSPVILRDPLPLVRAVDRDGRDVRELLAQRDGVAFQSGPEALRRATARAGPDAEIHDAVELELAPPAGSEGVGLHLTIRNSLLSTVLFYDVMLADQGARALDWLGGDLEEIGAAVELGSWAVEHLGLRVEALRGDEWLTVARIPDPGPIAWEDVAVVVPTGGETTVRLRLTFLTDGWRFDRIAAYGLAAPAPARRIPLAGVIGSDGTPQTEALASLGLADDRYLATTPGQRFHAVFEAGPGREAQSDPARDAEEGGARTFFLASQGYYTEWIRPAWIERGGETAPFRPTRDALVEALRRWLDAREELETRFFATKVPVR